MLKSANCLKKETAFQLVQRNGTRFKTAHLSGSFLVNASDASRFGVVVSKKISKLAVRRNRVRRIILAELAELLRSGNPQQGTDVVLRVIGLPEGDVSMVLRQEVKECFAKLLSV